MSKIDEAINAEAHEVESARGLGDSYQTPTGHGEGLLYAGGNRFLIRDTRAALIEKHKAKSRAILKGDMQ